MCPKLLSLDVKKHLSPVLTKVMLDNEFVLKIRFIRYLWVVIKFKMIGNILDERKTLLFALLGIPQEFSSRDSSCLKIRELAVVVSLLEEKEKLKIVSSDNLLEQFLMVIIVPVNVRNRIFVFLSLHIWDHLVGKIKISSQCTI